MRRGSWKASVTKDRDLPPSLQKANRRTARGKLGPENGQHPHFCLSAFRCCLFRVPVMFYKHQSHSQGKAPPLPIGFEGLSGQVRLLLNLRILMCQYKRLSKVEMTDCSFRGTGWTQVAGAMVSSLEQMMLFSPSSTLAHEFTFSPLAKKLESPVGIK